MDPVTFSWSPSTGLNTTTGPVVIATPQATTTYTVTATNNSTSETGNATVTITVDPASFTLAGTAAGPAVCQTFTVGGSGTTYRDNNCNLIAAVVPSGGSPVSGVISSCVRIDSGANKMGTLDLYVARRYDIEPATNPSTSSATITLYFLQSEFDNYNAKSEDSGLFNIPTGPSDAVGISNLRLRQFHGTGTYPGDYTGGRQDFKSTTPGVSITWNAVRNWWEITVPVTSFSGFYVSSRKGSFAVLPIELEYFKGAQYNKSNKLSWKVTCNSSQVVFEVERSSDAQNYYRIGKITADQARCNMPFDLTDGNPINGKNYYRIKIIDADGKYEYSNIILLNSKNRNFEIVGINPTLVTGSYAEVKINSEIKSDMLIGITDMAGRRIKQHTLQLRQGSNTIKLNTASLAPGAYLLGAYMAGEEPQTIQFIKQK